ncbi:molybdate ABC transporter substrate-binding protein [Rhodospira trueperi]|uniref:Molybdate transport system substrate-binding protein n=1 Tax=Rhodospira trueperi TaxID=69960 RepID=A0A1G7I3K3_9PROT|nr:molybdate ABC transporter substrate-binding protein [Rhodospira trueperi]SDF06974.1 molybdate transport system substrate-binding protein [Rhodospira trueperi]
MPRPPAIIRVLAAVAPLLLIAAVPAHAAEILVYAGAGLRPAIDTLADRFEAETGTTVIREYAGSGQLVTRFSASRRGDVLVPGSLVFFDALLDAGDVDTPRPIVAHTPVVGVAKAKAGEVTTFADLAKPGLRVGLGDPKAMALGRTAETILDASGMGGAIRANTVLRAGTVKQLALYVIQGDVDAAIIGRTDAVLNPDTIVMRAIPADWYTPEIVAAGVLSTSEDPELAGQFADFLASSDGIAAFEALGFLPVPDAAD